MLVRRSALPSLVTVTVAPGIDACCASRTNPEIWPASDCAAAVDGIAAVNATRTKARIANLLLNGTEMSGSSYSCPMSLSTAAARGIAGAIGLVSLAQHPIRWRRDAALAEFRRTPTAGCYTPAPAVFGTRFARIRL